MAAVYSTEKGDIQFKLGEATHMASVYQQRTSQNAGLVTQRNEIRQKIQYVKARKQDLQTAIETYERDFMDRKSAVPQQKPTFGTLQDIALGVFFIGLGLVFLLVVGGVWRSYAPTALNPVAGAARYGMTFVAVFFLFILGLLIAETVRRYA